MSFEGHLINRSTDESVADANIYEVAAGAQYFVTTTDNTGAFNVIGAYPEGAVFKASKVGFDPETFTAPPSGFGVGVYISPVGALPDLEVYPYEPVDPAPAAEGPNAGGKALAWGALLWWLFTNLGGDDRRRS